MFLDKKSSICRNVMVVGGWRGDREKLRDCKSFLPYWGGWSMWVGLTRKIEKAGIVLRDMEHGQCLRPYNYFYLYSKFNAKPPKDEQ